MKIKWTKAAFLIILMLMLCSCATSSKEEKKSVQEVPEKKEVLQKSEEKKIEKSVEESDEKRLERRDAEAIRRMAKEIARDRGADFYQTGMMEFNKGDFEDAIIAFNKAVDENPKDYQSHYALGLTYEKLARPKGAIASFEAALKIKPEYLPAREALGLLYFQQKKFQEAEAHLKVARILESQMAEVYYCLGEIEQREKACKTAIIAYKQALKLNPDYVAARNGLKAAEAACKKKKSSRLPNPVSLDKKVFAL